MEAMQGYVITFSVVPAQGADGKKIYRSRYTITGPGDELVESIQGDVEHEAGDDALDEAQLMGERRLSMLAADGLERG